MTEQPPPQPLLRVVKGDPTPEELAALVAVVSARSAAPAAAEAPRPHRSQWSANHRKLRATHRPGPGAWQASARSR